MNLISSNKSINFQELGHSEQSQTYIKILGEQNKQIQQQKDEQLKSKSYSQRENDLFKNKYLENNLELDNSKGECKIQSKSLFKKGIEIASQQNNRFCISTGIRGIDEKLLGGIKSKEITLVRGAEEISLDIVYSLCRNSLKRDPIKKIMVVDQQGVFSQDSVFFEYDNSQQNSKDMQQSFEQQTSLLKNIFYSRCYNQSGLLQIFSKLNSIIQENLYDIQLIILILEKDFDLSYQEQIVNPIDFYTKMMSENLHFLNKMAQQKLFAVSAFILPSKNKASKQNKTKSSPSSYKETLVINTPVRKYQIQEQNQNLNQQQYNFNQNTTNQKQQHSFNAIRQLPIHTRTPRNSLDFNSEIQNQTVPKNNFFQQLQDEEYEQQHPLFITFPPITVLYTNQDENEINYE